MKNKRVSSQRGICPPREVQRDLRQADTSLLETESDQLVYQLYGLSLEEIKIVEGKE